MENPAGTHRPKWKNIIKMDLNDTGCDNAGSINLTFDSVQWLDLVNNVMNLGFP
jgi:hypothetical protein